MFIDIYFTEALPVDRDEVEEAFDELPEFEVVGAGGGDAGTNLDLEVVGDLTRDEALRLVAEVLARLGTAELGYLRPSDTGERLPVTELL